MSSQPSAHDAVFRRVLGEPANDGSHLRRCCRLVSDRPLTPLTPLARVTLLLLKLPPGNPRLADELGMWADELRAVLDSGGVDEFVALLTYIASVSETPAGDLHELFAQIGPDAEEAYVTTAEMLRTEGRTHGRAEGRTEGRAEGRIEALRQLLELKFGPLPAGAVDQLRTASTDQLETWTARVLTAETLDDVLH